MRLGLLAANGLVLAGIALDGRARSEPARLAAAAAALGASARRSRRARGPRGHRADRCHVDRARRRLPRPRAAGPRVGRHRERAPRMRERPEVAHLHARALFHRGFAREALAAAAHASHACAERQLRAVALAKTARQVAFLEQVVAAGIDDPLANPAATRAAYERSTHEVRLVAMR